MGIYQEGPGQTDENFRRKYDCIARLGDQELRVRQGAMYELGMALSSDNRLTTEMQESLIANLHKSGLLTYDGISAELTEVKLKRNFDQARSELERNGKVQAHVIKAAALLSDDDITLSHRVLRVADLLAKIRNEPKNFIEPFTIKPYTASLNWLSDMEEEIHLQRLELVDRLDRNGLARSDMRMSVTALDLEEFKAFSKVDFIYTRLVALYFENQSTAQNIEERFRELQDVAHYGYTKDIRDTFDFYTKFGGV